MTAIARMLVDASQWLLHVSLKLLPIELTSSIGSFVVRTNARLNRPEILDGARRNLRQHFPSMGDAEANAFVQRFLENVGRVMGEYSVLHRLAGSGRLSLSGLEPVRARQNVTPLVCIVLHTGNWEAFGPALKDTGLVYASFYEPPESAAQRRIAIKTRQRTGITLLEPNARGLRDAIRILGDRGLVAIFGDEARKGVAMAPLFGREPHDRGNLAVAARLARRTGAEIVIAHCEREPRCRFKVRFSGPVPLPDVDAGILEDVAFLNRLVEPIIRANLDNWYYLDDAITPVSPSPAARVR